MISSQQSWFRRRGTPYLVVLLISLVATIVPIALIPDLVNPQSSNIERSVIQFVTFSLLVPVERFRSVVLGQFGTFDTMDYSGPRLWWHTGAVSLRSLLRHAYIAVPFWWAIGIAMFEASAYTLNRIISD